MFPSQRSSLFFGNGDRLDKKSWLKCRIYFKIETLRFWCLSGENKPESSETELMYFHHMETLGNKQLKGIISCLT